MIDLLPPAVILDRARDVGGRRRGRCCNDGGCGGEGRGGEAGHGDGGFVEVAHHEDAARGIDSQQRIDRPLQHPERRLPPPVRRLRPTPLRGKMHHKHVQRFPVSAHNVIPGLTGDLKSLLHLDVEDVAGDDTGDAQGVNRQRSETIFTVEQGHIDAALVG